MMDAESLLLFSSLPLVRPASLLVNAFFF